MFPTTVTLKGIESYYNEHDGASIFDDINLPEGIDKDILVPTIIMRAYDFPVLIINPQSINDQTKIWFDSHYDEFEHWIDVLTAEYDPLNDYDSYEKVEHHFEVIDDGLDQTSGGSKDKVTNSGHDGVTYGKTTTDSRAADNSSGWENFDKSQDSGTDTTNYGHVVTDDETHNGKLDKYNKHNDDGYTEKTQRGNDTASQDLLQKELDVRKFNIYETIANMYCLEFCVPIY